MGRLGAPGASSSRRAVVTCSNSFTSPRGFLIFLGDGSRSTRPTRGTFSPSRDVSYAHHPTNRNIRNLLRNLRLAWRLVRRERPRVVISTGAGVAVPFLWAARIYGARVIYVESFARTSGLSLTGRLVRPVVHRLFVQWPEAAGDRKAEFVGSIF